MVRVRLTSEHIVPAGQHADQRTVDVVKRETGLLAQLRQALWLRHVFHGTHNL